MTSITITFKDGHKELFLPQGRAGGSWSMKGEYKEGWYIVTDEYGTQTAFPASDIARVDTQARHSW